MDTNCNNKKFDIKWKLLPLFGRIIIDPIGQNEREYRGALLNLPDLKL